MESDQKRLLIAIIVGAVLVFAWYPAVTFIGGLLGYDLTTPPIEERVAGDTTELDDPTTRPIGPIAEVDGTDTPAAGNADQTLVPVGTPAPVTLGSVERDDETYALGIELTPNGGGIDSVVLNGFTQDVDADDPYVFEKAYEGGGDVTRPFTPLAIVVEDQRIDLSGATWGLDQSTASSARYGLSVTTQSGRNLRLYTDIALTTRDTEGAGFETAITYTIQNDTDARLPVSLIFAGPTTPPAELEDRPDRQIVAGFYEGEDFEVEQLIIQSFDEDAPNVTLGSELTDNAVLTWAGASTIYFQALVRPTLTDAQFEAGQIPQPFASVEATLLNPEVEDRKAREVALTFTTKTKTIEPGRTSELPLTVYFGPKLRSLMQSDYYNSSIMRFEKTLVAPTGCTFCVFDPVVNLLNALLRFWHWVFADWGLAIIGLVAIVRLALHPITKRSQINLMKMGKMGPAMKKLKDKYGDDKEAYAKAAWEVQKKQGMTPIWGCLPMFLQMPIWIALYQSLQTTFELRHAPFLYGFTWIDDLSKPDHLLEWEPVILPCLFFNFSISGLNLLPILLGVVFAIQMHIQPAPTAALSPEQEQQQKLMKRIFPFIFPIFLYPAPSGLNLYILTSTTIGIIESKIVRAHYKKYHEGDEDELIEVDIVETPKSKKGGAAAVAAPQTGIAGWFARLQEKAEQLQAEREAQLKAAKKKSKKK